MIQEITARAMQRTARQSETVGKQAILPRIVWETIEQDYSNIRDEKTKIKKKAGKVQIRSSLEFLLKGLYKGSIIQ